MSVRKRKRKLVDGSSTSSYKIHVKAKDPITGEIVTVRRSDKNWTKRDAIAFEREVRASIARGEYGRPERTLMGKTMTELAEHYMNSHVSVECAPSTCDSRQHILDRHILPIVGDVRVPAFSKEHVTQYKKYAQGLTNKDGSRRLSDATINNHLDLLTSMCKLAFQEGWVEREVTIKRLRAFKQEGIRREQYLDFEEVDALLEAAGAHRLILLLGVRTGLRPGELLGLKWKDIDFTLGVLTVQRTRSKGVEGPPKGRRTRDIALSDQVLDALKAAKRRGSYVFTHGSTRAPLTLRQLDTIIKRACDKAGIRRITPKGMRHTCASHLAMRGRTLFEIQEMLGHAQLRTTQIYAKLSPNHLRGVACCLDEPAPSMPGRGVSGSQDNIEPLKLVDSAPAAQVA